MTIIDEKRDLVRGLSSRSEPVVGLPDDGRTADGAGTVLVVVNLDPRHKHSAWLDLDLDLDIDLAALGVDEGASFQVHDLLGDERVVWSGARNHVELDPHTLPAHLFAVRRSVRSENQCEYFL